MRLIDADALDIDNLNRAYNDNFELDFGRLYTTDVIDMIANAPTINAIPIPEDATIGDAIMAMFPNVHIIEVLPKVHLFINNNMVARIDINVWNAPYKAESEDKE